MAAPVTVLTNREILKLAEGLQCLDGVSNNKDSVERYDFDAVKEVDLGWNVAKSRNIVERAVEVYQRELTKRGAKFGVVSKMKLTPENAANVAKFMEEEQKLLDGTQELAGLLKISRKHLKAAGVKIPGVYVSLMPLLTDT